MNTTSKKILTTLNLLYFSQVAVMVFFSIIVFYQITSSAYEAVQNDMLFFQYVLFAITPAGLGAGYFIFKKLTGAVSVTLPLKEKLMKYQTALLIRSACFEVPGFFAAVVAFITGNASMLLFTAVIIMLFILFRPTPSSIVSDLSLSRKEADVLNDPNGVI